MILKGLLLLFIKVSEFIRIPLSRSQAHNSAVFQIINNGAKI